MMDIEKAAQYDEIVTSMEYHSHKPYASSTFNCNDEIRIPISQMDIITAPFESTLHVTGTLVGKKGADNVDMHLVNNAIAYLFDDIRYEIGGIEIDRTKNVGITTSMKNYLSVSPDEHRNLENACWFGAGVKKKISKDSSAFSFSIPLRKLLGFGEDYRRVVMNVKQELILLRSSTDINAIFSADATTHTLTITNVYWRVPHLTVSDTLRLKMLRMIEKDTAIHIPFRSWELHEYPILPQTDIQSWTIKTSSQLEKPRYVIVGFQTDRKNKLNRDMSGFDQCALKSIKLYLNSQYFPYDKLNGDLAIFYEMFAQFQGSYYGDSSRWPRISIEEFRDKTPLYVINCSRQNDLIKTGSVDVRLEFEAASNFPAGTTAYCLLIHDSHYVYTLLTGSVKKMM